MIESDKDYLVQLGQNIAKRRKVLMMTQADLAFKVSMEVPNLSVIENGKSNPQLLTLLKIAAALKCELSEILPQIGNPDQVFEMRPKYIPRKHKGFEG
jgi:transcriptional regulator with XRE-family HTH domain